MKDSKFQIILLLICLYGCADVSTKKETPLSNAASIQVDPATEIRQTLPSHLENQYQGFNSPLAINRLANIENEYYTDCASNVSRYHGTVWKEQALENIETEESNLYDRYKNDLASKDEVPYPLDCTLYSIEGLKSGLGSKYKDMNRFHKQIWNNRGYAGWSVGYVLVEEFDWKAYLFVSKNSKEYTACMKNFKKDQKYHVWRQPDIPIEKVFDFDTDQASIDSLLSQHEFGWGFSEQGWHTWITRFTTLKECNWLGSPSDGYQDQYHIPLFIDTKFTEYYDYDSHVIIFPAKKSTFQTQN